jgi:hypothetical protein
LKVPPVPLRPAGVVAVGQDRQGIVPERVNKGAMHVLCLTCGRMVDASQLHAHYGPQCSADKMAFTVVR